MTGYTPLSAPSVTAVVPMYNEADCIEACVASLRAQDFAPLEIIAVDDGSSDGSDALCGRLGVRVLRQAHRGPGAARNAGARAAAGDILLFIDADMTFAPDYVSRLAAPLVSGAAAAACHWNELVSNWENPWARCQAWFFGLPDGRRQPAAMPEKESVYRAVRKDFFLASGGFAEDEGRGDDASVSRRTGVYAVMVPDATCYHRNISGPAEIFREAMWTGRHVVVGRQGRLRRCLSALLVYRNPLVDAARSLVTAAVKKEPRLPAYSLLYSCGYYAGMLSALLTGEYRK